MDIYISYVVKLPNKPIVYVYRVANEDEAKKAAVAYFDNEQLPDVTVIEQTPFRGRIPGYSSEEDNALIDEYIDKAEYIHPIEVVVSNQYASASIEDNMIMTITANDNVLIHANSDDHDDGKHWLITSHLKITPVHVTSHVNNDIKEDDKE